MKEVNIEKFHNYYFADLYSLGLCDYYNLELRVIGSDDVVETITQYYGFAVNFIHSRDMYEIKESIRNIFIPE